ncbi:MAG: aminotransferase class I/II-fold pyridoxal phosphate-dependent enzyme [Bacteroidetes bacterium]|nr:aminotransferase class I/II-fold pyridoxal phosphate-dependent enzyme [Bacteroidota bacterium]
MLIDLRSDTVTRPTPGMKEAMFTAEVGDDVFGEDPTVSALEQKVAIMFGMEAGLFCPSGTMTNQIAIKVHTQPLDEIICDQLCHIYNYETGGWAFHSGVSVRLTEGERGIMTAEQIEKCIQADFDWLPNSRLVAIENTVNKGGGSVYSMKKMKSVSDFCRKKNLALHLDGARIFNALTALRQKPIALEGMFDSISVCMSKGLGAPVGSVLLGSKEFIRRARKIRKVMGGGMRQSGILAAACVYALDKHVSGLKEDHRRAKELEKILGKCSWVKSILPVETNIVIFEVADSKKIAIALQKKKVLIQPFSSTQLRMVTHLDFTDEMLSNTLSILRKI